MLSLPRSQEGVHHRKLFPCLRNRSCDFVSKQFLILQPVGMVKIRGIALAAAVSAQPIDMVSCPLSFDA